MSRSYRKSPVIKDNGKGKKKQKAIANRVVRRKLKNPDYVVPNGGSYTKEYESWRIADYTSRCTEEEAKEMWHRSMRKYPWFKEHYPTLESYMIWWKKTYRSK